MFWGKQVKEEELMKAGRGMEVKHKYEKDEGEDMFNISFFSDFIKGNNDMGLEKEDIIQ